MGKIFSRLFFKMFNISSSSNGLFPLMINVGLFRQICENGQIVSAPGSSLSYRTKHFDRAIETVFDEFIREVPSLQDAFGKQVDFISRMNEENVSLKRFLQTYLLENKKGEPVKYLVENSRHLMNKLKQSNTDKLDYESLQNDQKEALDNPMKLANNERGYEDILLSKFKLFNCYTEIFRYRNNVSITKETTRIFNILNNLN